MIIHPKVHHTAIVADSAVIGAGVTIGERTEIREGVIIGALTTIGKLVVIQEGVTIPALTTIPAYTTVTKETRFISLS